MAADGRGRLPRRANGERGAEVLAVLQQAGEPLIPSEVAERIGGELAYSTVVTILTRMYAKGLLTRTPRGRAFAYAPVTDEDGFAARRMRGVLDERPDREAVLSRFVDELTGTDEELLRQLLDPDTGPGR
ncbi:BlaI/MecI/CopY family transcriptional regulator [Streptomyces sp. NBC_00841]|uniref:BlaI/MecI/CopY family transcriptional regulator n=1 Tax=unclassified Streptomyces TaxID=2593676 RepID=UPI00224D468A|nr:MULTISPECIES: BlaI/MecI/CopY family transcriptional regulator [unclassified Streptomyces]MCX4530150.1 BlaI/MecI/CopY family transcriptional regulator [Streptomyces sp. NBC_01669]WSA04066.1 BlaI/MecI/CopY family transcriptional regulator [Streptomyces sp. NBC_00841]